ncbi:MAG: protein kinase [Polyangiaceae bacterium]|nr:protein kinase [Polyangiaceae bacterium]
MTQTLASTTPAAPRIVGRYALYDAIASGGMASVHLGRLIGPAGFSRTVAIKRLHENYAKDPEFVAMLLDEARLAARINHPNVVSTLDVVASGPELLVVMEYIAGESLAALIRTCREAGHPPPIPVVVDIAIGMLRGLHAAHEATGEGGQPLNIVHRDVSPQNVLVGSDGVTRVVDFGVAKAAGRTQQTQSGAIKGKPGYMAPEQVMGAPATRAVDTYSASVVLWEALTCERLFMGDTDATTVYHVLKNRVPAPSFIRSEIPPALDAVVVRGLRGDPSARWGNAKAMADALEATAKPVARSSVANWVTQTVPDTICRRQALVSAVESSVIPVRSLMLPARALLDASRGDEASAAATAAASGIVTTGSPEGGSPWTGTRLKGTPTPISQPVLQAPRRAIRKPLWLLLAVAAAAGVAALIWTRVRVVPEPTAVTPATAETRATSPSAISRPAPSMPPEPSAVPAAEPAQPQRPVVSATSSAAPRAKEARRLATPVVKATPMRPKAKLADRIYRRD